MSDPARRIAIVVPCYNEEQRLETGAFERFAAEHPEVRFVLVDDGSRDGTLARLRQLHERMPQAFEVVDLGRNHGKAEAVRSGMLRAFALGAELAGYWDADLATPLSEIERFADVLARMPERLVVLGARVQLLGRAIARSPRRHYFGRVFATLASLVLGLPVYDTQCGAKLFRVTDITRALFAQPFAVGWSFDVELIARLIRLLRQLGRGHATELMYELPLQQWRDVPGSKVTALDFPRALIDMLRIRRRYLRRGAPALPLPEPALQRERVPM